MSITDALAVCGNWLSYLDHQRWKSEKLQMIAGQSRRGEIDKNQARRMVSVLDRHAVVYDGAELSQAVVTLMNAIVRKETER